jgi:hypothetical protein
MVGFDIPFAFVAAGALNWRAQGKRPDLAMLMGTAGVAVPGLAYLERFPDWDLQYFVDPSTLPMGMSAVFMLAITLSAYAGMKVGPCCPKWILAGLGVMVAVLIGTLPRTLAVGKFADYHACAAPTIGKVCDMPVIGMDWLMFGLPWFALHGLIAAYCIWGVEKTRREAAA